MLGGVDRCTALAVCRSTALTATVVDSDIMQKARLVHAR